MGAIPTTEGASGGVGGMRWDEPELVGVSMREKSGRGAKKSDGIWLMERTDEREARKRVEE